MSLKELSYNELAVGVMEPLNYTSHHRNDSWVRLVIAGQPYKLSPLLAAQLGRRLTDYAKVGRVKE